MAMTLRTDAELDEALTRLSEQRGISKQDLVRTLVLDEAERLDHRSRVADASARMREEWGDVLDRLGSV